MRTVANHYCMIVWMFTCLLAIVTSSRLVSTFFYFLQPYKHPPAFETGARPTSAVEVLRQSLVNTMTTYHGHVHTRDDAILLFEACQLNVLPRIQRRLSNSERKILIQPGSVFLWDEVEAGIKRWTDGRLWSSIVFDDGFIVRREMESGVEMSDTSDQGSVSNLQAERDPGEDSRCGKDGDVDSQMDQEMTDGYKYKADGLIRRSVTITASGRQLHLVTYHDSAGGCSAELPSPSTDQRLMHLIDERIAERRRVPFTETSNDPRYGSGSIHGIPSISPTTFPGHYLNGSSPPSRRLHHPVDSSHHCNVRTDFPHTRNEDVMQLYMLLASLPQTQLSTPSHQPLNHHNNTASQTLGCQIQTIQALPLPPQFPAPSTATNLQTNYANLNVPSAEINVSPQYSPYFALPSSREIPHPAGKSAMTNIQHQSTHQTIKVHKDDQRAVRALDKRFLAP